MPEDAPEAFLGAVEALRSARLRPEVAIEEVPAPQRIAPYAAALSADVIVDDTELATGRFVLLHDPDGQDAWRGTFRAVTFARAALEPELGSDPLLGQVGWTWLQESLSAAEAEHTAELALGIVDHRRVAVRHACESNKSSEAFATTLTGPGIDLLNRCWQGSWLFWKRAS
jgi:hypothetical protein